MPHSHQLNMFSVNSGLKNEKQTWKARTQGFTQDSYEIQHVLKFALN